MAKAILELEMPVKKGRKEEGEKMFSISKQDALKIVQAMRMLKLMKGKEVE